MNQMKKIGRDEAADALERELHALRQDLDDVQEHLEPEPVRFAAPFTGAGQEERESIH